LLKLQKSTLLKIKVASIYIREIIAEKVNTILIAIINLITAKNQDATPLQKPKKKKLN
jgi:hypothetical protein